MISESQLLTRKEVISEYKKLRGKSQRRRDKSISDKLHEAHKPYDQRP